MMTPGNNESVLQNVETKGLGEYRWDEGAFLGASQQIEDLANVLKTIAANPGWEAESATAASEALNATSNKLLTHADTILEVMTIVDTVKTSVSGARTAYELLPSAVVYEKVVRPPMLGELGQQPRPWENPAGSPDQWTPVTNPARDEAAATALSKLNADMTAAIESAANIQERLNAAPIVDPSGAGSGVQAAAERVPRSYNDDVEPYEWSHPNLAGVDPTTPGSGLPGGSMPGPGSSITPGYPGGPGTYHPSPGSGSDPGYPGADLGTAVPGGNPGASDSGSSGGSNSGGKVSVDGGSTGTIPGVSGGGGGAILSTGWPGGGSGGGGTQIGGQSGLSGSIAGVGAVGGSALAGGAGLLTARAGSGGLAGALTGPMGGAGSANGAAGARGLSGGLSGSVTGAGPRAAGGSGVPGVSGAGAGGSNAVMGGGGMGGGAGGAGKSGRKRSSGGFVVPGLEDEEEATELGWAARAGSRSQVVAPAVVDEDDSDTW
ncbi:hypothetical protein SAMN05216410_0062 [Sanguibacter gelidistatuariae]|uniref:PPE family protein n=1 Tax=Sanguibacter gelidistatuariae TaxID=1814289 RepID=A0A1G6X3E8_9MICO|nr:hypothetical protein [Sanguibacter gelidistatuariae]SDD71917.1 hypothetical protein SAMN05216410_0062 [Sanguibacter gelidistatuariae]